MDINKQKNKSGQALVEFCIGLIAILTVVGGIFLIGDMGLARTDARVEATEEASRASLYANTNAIRQVPNYIQQMDSGGDQSTYSTDDISVRGGAGDVLLRLVPPQQSQILSNYVPSNSLANLQTINDLMDTTGLVRGEGSETVDIRNFPIVRRLFIDQEQIGIDVTAWSVRTGDLY